MGLGHSNAAMFATSSMLVTVAPRANSGTSRVFAALGDSYSAGVGTGAPTDACYRSPYGFPVILAERLSAQLQYQACNGATTSQVQAGQLQVLNASTNYVSLVVGANDLGFAPIFIECAKPGWISDCSGAIRRGYGILHNQLPGRYDSLYRAIRNRAPNAQVVVAGYPHLFNGTNCNLATFFSASEMRALNGAADDLDALISTKASQHGFEYVDPRAAFTGHAVCDRVEWINGLSYPIIESYHLNRAGNRGYADLFSSVLSPAPAASDSEVKPPEKTAQAAGGTLSLRDRADHVLAMALDSPLALAKAHQAGVPSAEIVSATAQLRSDDAGVVQRGLERLQALNNDYERARGRN